MKKTSYIVLALLAVNIFSCNKDDAPPTPKPVVIDKPDPKPDSEPEPENRAPGAFTLLEVKDKDTAVTLLPTFRWNTSTDPDGDMVGYDLLIGKNENYLDTLAINLNTAVYTIQHPLTRLTEYYWQVKARDSAGKETPSDLYSFITKRISKPRFAQVAGAQFSKRFVHTTTSFNDRLWLIGGQKEDGSFAADVWYSDNGINWHGIDESNDNSGGFGVIRGHTAINFNDRLWILGGKNSLGRTNNIFFSDDGINWGPAKSPGWSGRELHTTVVFKGKVWVLGGVSESNEYFNEVWTTVDINNWSMETAPWSGRFGHSSVVFDDKLWVIGGRDGNNILNDVWYTDGTTWTQVTQQQAFSNRMSHQTVVFDNKMWLIGGNDDNRAVNYMSFSEDGATWNGLNKLHIPARTRPTTAVLNNKLLVIGGWDYQNYLNDIWVFD
jgi:hypothetical protein